TLVVTQTTAPRADNQRMVCPPESLGKDAAGNATCKQALLYIHDVGYGFGEATLFDTSKSDLSAWEDEPIWKDPARCVGNLKKSLLGTLPANPPIGEGGRKFLADL